MLPPDHHQGHLASTCTAQESPSPRNPTGHSWVPWGCLPPPKLEWCSQEKQAGGRGTETPPASVRDHLWRRRRAGDRCRQQLLRRVIRKYPETHVSHCRKPPGRWGLLGRTNVPRMRPHTLSPEPPRGAHMCVPSASRERCAAGTPCPGRPRLPTWAAQHRGPSGIPNLGACPPPLAPEMARQTQGRSLCRALTPPAANRRVYSRDRHASLGTGQGS